jgi:hypothetical protein
MAELVSVGPLKNANEANKYARFGILFDEQNMGVLDLFYKLNRGTLGENVRVEGQQNVVVVTINRIEKARR